MQAPGIIFNQIIMRRDNSSNFFLNSRRRKRDFEITNLFSAYMWNVHAGDDWLNIVGKVLARN
jgi:hypothetical protein